MGAFVIGQMQIHSRDWMEGDNPLPDAASILTFYGP
jgi:hypothetical protein